MSEVIKALAHSAHALNRLSVGYRKMAKEYPWRREHFLTESHRLRLIAQWDLARARRLKEAA